jgi:hypothetical protein
MTVDLPVSTLDVNTQVITSKTKTTITREDFKLTGDSVVFDTVKREGWLVGNVHMIIYKLDAEIGAPSVPAPESAAPQAPTPAAASPK